MDIVLLDCQIEISAVTPLPEGTPAFNLIVPNSNWVEFPVAINDAPKIINVLGNMFSAYLKQLVVCHSGKESLPDFLKTLPQLIDEEIPYIALMGL